MAELTRRELLLGAAAVLSMRGASPTDLSLRGDLLRAPRAQDISDSPWGLWAAYGPPLSLQASELLSVYSLDEGVLDLLAESGVKNACVRWDWPAVEKARGRYDFSVYDRIVAGLHARKITPLVQLYGSPNRAYGMDPATKDGVMLRKDCLEAWLGAINLSVERWRGSAGSYEIWCAPNATPWFWSGNPDPALYAKMVGSVARVVRSADPQPRIAAGALAGVPMDYVRGFLAADSGNDWNCFSFHPYGEYPEAETPSILQLAAALRSHRGQNVPLLQSECGYPSSKDTAGWTGEGPWGESIQARWLLRRMLTDLAVGSKISVYLLLQDIPGVVDEGPAAGSTGVNKKGLVTQQGRRKPAFRALQNLCALIDDRFTAISPHGTIRLAFENIAAGENEVNVRSVALTHGRALTHFMVWDASPIRADYKETVAEVELPHVLANRYVSVDLLSGEILPVKARSRRADSYVFEIPLKDYPIALVDHSVLGRPR